MGDVGKGMEKGIAGVGNFMGLGGEQELGGGGNFAMTAAASQGETEALQRMRDRASGSNSVTELRYKQAMDDMIKAQQAGAASARGVSNQALLNRNVSQAAQQNQLEMTREVAAQKLAEQQAADAGLIQAAAAQRGVALNAATQEAQLAEAAGKRRAEFTSSIAAAATQAAAGSDENMKENIKKGNATDKISEFLGALKSYNYNYKDDKANGRENPDGEVTSVMAQDLEKSELGRQMVKDGPDGKEVDYGQGLAAMLAGIAELNERTKKLEKKV